MRLNDISKPKTADNLNENLAKRFGQKINIEKFTLEQLQDVRNKIRTKMSQFESQEKYESVLKDSEYQKNKLFLDVLNQAIAEREDISDQETKEASKPDFPDIDGDGNTKEPISQAAKDKKAKGGDKKKKDLSKVPPQLRKHMKGENVQEGMGEHVFSEIEGLNDVYDELEQLNREKMGGGISEQLDIMRQHIEGLYRLIGKDESQMEGISPVPRNGKCPSGWKLSPDGKKCLRAGKSNMPTKGINPMDEGKAIIENYFKHLLEGEEDKAEIVMAAKDMVDRVTSWMEDTAEMQAESMLELGDAIRDEMGQAQSETYIQTVKPALESLYQSLEATRASLTSGVAKLTGEEEPAVDMGADAPGMAAEPGMDAEEPMAEPEDDFGAAEPAAGGEEEAGRAKRESIERSVRLGQILSSKKK